MKHAISKLLDVLSNYLAHRKGLLPIIGLLLLIVNLIVQFIFPGTLIASTNLFLHLGLFVAILGLMLAWAL